LYEISTNSRSDVLGLAGFVNWLEQLETKEVTILRGQWGDPLQVRKPSHLILLGDYLELWDASDAAIEVSSRGLWNSLEKLTCEKIYVVGNHDFASTQTLGRFPQGASSIEILPNTYPEKMNEKAEWWKIGNANYLLLHGHQFDQSFRYSRRGWMLVSYFRDGAEAFRLWSRVLVIAAIVSSILSWFLPILLSLPLTLFLAGALPRIILAFARPVWNHFAPRYQPIKALKGFVEWWKSFISRSQVPSGQLCVVYGHTHLMDVFDSSEAEEATGTKLPEQLTLINIPSWVLDTREEYQEILRDVSLYIDSNGFHLLGWDWRKLQPFYIPTDVAKRLATGTKLDEQTAQSLATIGWPEKLLNKLKEPPRILVQNYPINRPVVSALDFIDSRLKSDETGSDYYEVAEQDHPEHMVYNQSQYLLSVAFKLLGKESLAQSIRRKHNPDEPDNDPNRKEHKAKDRFCVLEGDTREFYLAGQDDAENSDEIALLALYWLNIKDPILGNRVSRSKVDKLWKKLLPRYDPVKGILAMDKADRDVAQRQGFEELYPVYKVALFAILAKNMKDMQTLDSVREKLRMWQHSGGGWETDRTADSKPIGVANLETTALAILALAD